MPANFTDSDPSAADAPPKPAATGRFATDVTNVLRGYCMGAADTVPGISGGTVALILGHYQRLVTAISHFDRHALGLLKKRAWREAAQHCDLRFVIGLGIGVVGGIVTLASLMHWLLDHRMPETLSVFFGLVLASSLIVAQQMKRWSFASVGLCGAAGVAAFALCGLGSVGGEPSLPFIFLAAMIAICAMILPGISGAFVLLLLGVYQPITGLIKDLARGQVTAEGFLKLSLFGIGCVVGLALFSRLLRWLLQHHHDMTYAALLGLMLGSLRRLWPLQQATAATADAKFSQRDWQFVPPSQWPGSLSLLIALAVAGCVAVLVVEAVGRRFSHSPPPSSHPPDH